MQDLEQLNQIAAKFGTTPETVRNETEADSRVNSEPPPAASANVPPPPPPPDPSTVPPVQLQSLSAPQALFAMENGSNLKLLPNGKAIDQQELALYNMVLQTELSEQVNSASTAAIAPRPTAPITPQSTDLHPGGRESNPGSAPGGSSIEITFTQTGIIALVCLAMGFTLIMMSMIKIWGTTDTARNEEYAARMERSFDELGKRYDRLAKATEKVGKKADVCVAFVCGGAKDDTAQEASTDAVSPAPIKPGSDVSSDYDLALQQIRTWQSQSASPKTIQAYIAWIEQNPGQGYPSAQALRRAYAAMSRQPSSISAQYFRG